jgi:hypothetical protein
MAGAAAETCRRESIPALIVCFQERANTLLFGEDSFEVIIVPACNPRNLIKDNTVEIEEHVARYTYNGRNQLEQTETELDSELPKFRSTLKKVKGTKFIS